MPLTRRALAACLAAALLAPNALQAQTFPVKFIGATNQNLRGGPIGIPAYQIAFITQQQGTASGGVMTKSRLTTTLTNVPEDLMRRLTDEAYADLKSQFTAAGIPLIDEAPLQAAVAATGVPRFENNADITRIGPGITIGKSVKKSYAAFGATAAPGLQGLHAPVVTNGLGRIGAFTTSSKLGPVAMQFNGTLVMPSLVLDFGQTSAAAGRDFLGRESAGVSNKVAFGISLTTGATLLTTMNNGRAVTPGLLYMPPKDLTAPTPFATVATGAGAVRALSVATVVDSNYIKQDTSRGDAVIVDLPIWESLVRQAYKDYNGAIVAAFKKARG